MQPTASVRETPAAGDARDELAALLPRLRRFARGLARGDEATADDVVQTALERALGRLHLYRPGTRLDSWACRIVQNAWRDELRRRRARGLPVGVEEDMVVEDGARRADERLLLAAALRAVAGLPGDQRRVLVLVALGGRSYREAADELGAPIGTVMSRLARARGRLEAAVGGAGARGLM